MVAIDQRGTGATRCAAPRCRREMGASDLTPPTRAAVTDCARRDRAEAALLHHRGHRRGPRGAADRARRPTSSRSTAPPTGPTPRSATRSPTRSASAASCWTRSSRSRTSACSRRSRSRPRGESSASRRPRTSPRSSATQRNGPEMLDLLTLLSVGAPARQRRRRTRSRRPPTANDGAAEGAAGGRRRGSMDGYTAPAAQPGPAREHAVRRRARALGRRVGPAARAASRRSTTPRRSSARRTSTRTTARPRPATGSRSSACYWPPVDVPARAGPGARCPTSRPSCWPATRTSRPRWNGRSETAERAPAGRADHRRGRGPRRPEPGRPEGARGGTAPSIAGVIDELIRTRRTHKAFGPDPVPHDVLLELFELARWAPNHHLTDPWRFRVLGRAREGAAEGRRRGLQARLGRRSSTARRR